MLLSIDDFGRGQLVYTAVHFPLPVGLLFFFLSLGCLSMVASPLLEATTEEDHSYKGLEELACDSSHVTGIWRLEAQSE